MASINLLRLSARQYICNRSIRPSPSTIRRFSQTPLSRFPKKGSEEKDSINAEPSEYSKSGTDQQAAQKDSAAYDPSTTDPQKEKDLAGVGDEDENPLEVSPANPQVSKQLGPEKDGGPENSAKGQKRSQSGHPRKNGEPGKNA